MKTILFGIFTLFFCANLVGQVGIGTTDPQGILDIDSNNAGMVIPRVESTDVIQQINGNFIENGTLVYNEELDKFCFFINDAWFCPEIEEVCNTIDPIADYSEECDAYTYFKPLVSTTSGRPPGFGSAIALSDDGNVLVVGAPLDASSATGINGDPTPLATTIWNGAVYVFVKNNSVWEFETYIKPAVYQGNRRYFGHEVAISGDGQTIAATGLTLIEDGDPSNDTSNAQFTLATYVFERQGATWVEKTILNPLHDYPRSFQWYQSSSVLSTSTSIRNSSLSLNNDGTLIAFGQPYKSESAVNINGAVSNTNLTRSGAVDVFRKQAGSWNHEAFLKSNLRETFLNFGSDVAFNATGNRLIVGMQQEQSLVNGGRVYVYDFNGSNWSRSAIVAPMVSEGDDRFGYVVALDAVGTTMAVGAVHEDGVFNCVDGDQDDNRASNAGAAYVFLLDNTTWIQEAYLKPENAATDISYGISIAISNDGNKLIVGAKDSSNAQLYNGESYDNSEFFAGSAYIYNRCVDTWNAEAYLKSPYPDNIGTGGHFRSDYFSFVEMSGDGNTIAVGAPGEDSPGTGVNSGLEAVNETGSSQSGAVFLLNACNI